MGNGLHEPRDFFPVEANSWAYDDQLREAIRGRDNWGFVDGYGLLYAPDGEDGVVVAFYAYEGHWYQRHYVEKKLTGGTASHPPSTSAPLTYQLDRIEQDTRSARRCHARNLAVRAART